MAARLFLSIQSCIQNKAFTSKEQNAFKHENLHLLKGQQNDSNSCFDKNKEANNDSTSKISILNKIFILKKLQINANNPVFYIRAENKIKMHMMKVVPENSWDM